MRVLLVSQEKRSVSPHVNSESHIQLLDSKCLTMSDIRGWFNNLPIMTRTWFGLSVALPLLGKIGLVTFPYMILNGDFISKFQIWRPLTALFYYPITPQTGFHFMTNLYFLYTYSLRLEKGHFVGRPADYLFMLTFNWGCISLLCYWMNTGLLMDPMVISVLYVWCQLNKDVTVNFWFGTQFKAYLLPWVLLGFNMVLNGGGMFELIGIVVGHLYYFVMFKYPEDSGSAPLLATPSLFYSYFPSVAGRGGFSGFQDTSNVRVPRSAVRPGGHSWGSGRSLGGN
ncbi:Derlin-1 [Halotydeus destructor]|nr:Derlin-1 [Halotydeus destructor]